jgi:uncharacterized protein YabE (DUF348 family)
MRSNGRRKHIKYTLLFISGIICSLAFTGCGKKVDVIVKDMYIETKITVPVGQTVESVLQDAEIQVENKDKIIPSLDTEISEDTTEISISRHVKTYVEADSEITTLEMTGGKVKDALEKTGITLGKHDTLNHDLEAYITDGMQIVVERRIEISLVADGETKNILAGTGTVEDFLQEQGIKLGKKDRIEPKLSEKLKEGMKVVVKRVDVKKVTETETIAYGTQTKQSNSMTVGTSKITRQGSDGKKKVTYKVTYVDGKEESRKIIKEEVIKEAVDQIVTTGTKPKEVYVVSKEKVYDCDGSGHGYYIIKYSDGTVKYVDF